MTERRYRRISGLCLFLAVVTGLQISNVYNPHGSADWLLSFAAFAAPFVVAMFVMGWFGRRRPTHEYDRIWWPEP